MLVCGDNRLGLVCGDNWKDSCWFVEIIFTEFGHILDIVGMER